MRNVVILAVAAGLVLPTAAYARPATDQRQQARIEARVDARLDARQDRREARQDRREDRREARQERREDRREYRQAQRQNYRDWRAYRQAERNAFRRDAYVAPRGYRYRPVRVGARLDSNLFWGSRYWINARDYYLPQPRHNYQRYIRYGNDVLLINTRNGRVIAVYDRFFW